MLKLLLTIAPVLAYANDAAINAGAKGAVTGAAMGIIAGIAAIAWMIIRKLIKTAKAAAPKVKDAASQAVEKGRAVAQDFASRNKVCPFCAETIKRDAVVCYHCKRDLSA
jgi:hypothetical protein